MTFSVGNKIILVNHQPGNTYYKVDKIFKVHKNGNCRLKDMPQQYSSSGHSTANSYFGNTIELWTQEREDELKSKRAISARLRDFRSLVDKLRSAANKKPSNISVKTLSNLRDMLWELME